MDKSPYRMMTGAVRPGHGEPQPLSDLPSYTHDSPADIRRCLDCPVPPDKCQGQCGAGMKPRGRVGVSGRREIEASQLVYQVARLTNKGWWAVDIAKELGLTENQVTYQRKKAKKMGLLSGCKRTERAQT